MTWLDAPSTNTHSMQGKVSEKDFSYFCCIFFCYERLNGHFTGVFTESIDCDFAFIEHKTYVHMKYVRLLVSTLDVLIAIN